MHFLNQYKQTMSIPEVDGYLGSVHINECRMKTAQGEQRRDPRIRAQSRAITVQ